MRKSRSSNSDQLECFIDDRCRFFYCPREKLHPVKRDHPLFADTLPRPSKNKVLGRNIIEGNDATARRGENGATKRELPEGENDLVSSDDINPYAVFHKQPDGENRISYADGNFPTPPPPTAPPRDKNKNPPSGESPIYSQINKLTKKKKKVSEEKVSSGGSFKSAAPTTASFHTQDNDDGNRGNEKSGKPPCDDLDDSYQPSEVLCEPTADTSRYQSNINRSDLIGPNSSRDGSSTETLNDDDVGRNEWKEHTWV